MPKLTERSRRRRRAAGLSPQQAKNLATWLQRNVHGRHDLARLTDAEQQELYAFADGDKPIRDLEGRDRDRYESLIEKSAGIAVGHWRRVREAGQVGREAAAMLADLARPAPQPRHEQPGTVVIPAEWLRWMSRGRLPADHLSVFVVVAGQLEAGAAWHRTGAVEPGPDGLPTLTVDGNLGLGGSFDPWGVITPTWKRSIGWLEENRFLAVERRGKTWRIRYGPRALKARRGSS